MWPNYEVGWSQLAEPKTGFYIDKFQLNAGQYITGSMGIIPGSLSEPIRGEKSDFVRQLMDMGNEFFVIHDVDPAVRKAWLLDGLSTLLHLVRSYLHNAVKDDDYRCLNYLRHTSLRTLGGLSGRRAAFETLKDETNRALPIYLNTGSPSVGDQRSQASSSVEDLVKDMLHYLWQILDHESDNRPGKIGVRISVSPWRELVGFDFTAISSNRRQVQSRMTLLHDEAEGCVKLTRSIHAPALFGRGFGDLWQPDVTVNIDGTCPKCLLNSPAPSSRDILAASISDLERVSVANGITYDKSWQSLFAKCSIDNNSACQNSERIQHIRTSTMGNTIATGTSKRPRLDMINMFSMFVKHAYEGVNAHQEALNDCGMDISEGAVLLGKPRNFLRKRLQSSAASAPGQPFSPQQDDTLCPLKESPGISTQKDSAQSIENRSVPNYSIHAGVIDATNLDTVESLPSSSTFANLPMVVVTLMAKSPEDIEHPSRRIVFTPERSTIKIGRTTGNRIHPHPALLNVPGSDNGWFECPVMSRNHAELSCNFGELVSYHKPLCTLCLLLLILTKRLACGASRLGIQQWNMRERRATRP